MRQWKPPVPGSRAADSRVNTLPREVAAGAHEQSLGIAQIGQAVNELDRMTQQNAALVEQTAAAVAAMKGQAADLTHEVDRFQLPPGLVLEESRPVATAADFNFDQAIEAHRQWKVRLRKAIAEHTHLDAETICRGDRGPLGQWLHGAGGQRWSDRPGFVSRLETHAQFHAVAGSVARQVNAGAYAEAERLIGSGSRFAQLSTDVCTLLTRAKRGL